MDAYEQSSSFAGRRWQNPFADGYKLKAIEMLESLSKKLRQNNNETALQLFKA